MSKKLKKKIIRISVGAAIFAATVICEHFIKNLSVYIVYALYISSFLVVGFNVLKNAFLNIFRGRVFDENFLMSLASIGAFFVGESKEAVAVMLFYQVGECFQSYAVGKSRKSISSLMKIRPESARVIRNSQAQTVRPEEVAVGEIIEVKPGELIPLDGEVVSGSGALDTAALTGESIPRDVCPGDRVLSGSVNLSGLLRIKVSGEYSVSTVAKILDLVENQASKKAHTENFITKFARVYTPIVVCLAVVLAVIPPLFIGIGDGKVWSEWVYRALSFLVVSCPCALVISVPLSFFGGLGGAGRRGILIKGANYLEALAKTTTVVMDKTGTLTHGTFSVSKIVPHGVDREELLKCLAYAECSSNHPIALSVTAAYPKQVDKGLISSVNEIAGFGVEAVVQGSRILAGNGKFMAKNAVEYVPSDEVGTVVYCARDGKYIGCVVISDEIKPDAGRAIEGFKALGVKNVVMLTGDNEAAARQVSKQLGIGEYHASLLPADKVGCVERLIEGEQEGEKLLFVGDGINDAPVLAGADIGVAMGGVGSDAAIEAADVVIMTDEPSKINEAIAISRRTLRIAKENIIFAIAVKVIMLALCAFGVANMWAAVFADVGVAVIAILNAMRCLRSKQNIGTALSGDK